MKSLTFAWLALGVLLFVLFPIQPSLDAQSPALPYSASDETKVLMFSREDCGFCKEQLAFLEEEGLPYKYYNILEDEEAKRLYDLVVEKHDLSRVTPITIVGERVFVGFNGPRTTGQQIKEQLLVDSDIKTIQQHLDQAPVQSVEAAGSCTDVKCDMGNESQFVFDLPYFGVVDLRTFSLTSLSLTLGVIDGLNPCAMWALITFLVLLSQAGSKNKMIFFAGIFILAQGIMYNLILNVWYKTWDWVALDQIVTPLVGFLALGGASFFLWRWYKNKNAQLVCDITDLDTQSKTVNKFKQIVEQPITIASVFAILVIAFSINVIEFACSIGIPQAYTKILELNMLTFMERQWYILVFTLGYMFDDVVVFGLAIWGYSKLQSHGGKYAQMSLLVGGILMLLLGLILIINPSLLVI